MFASRIVPKLKNLEKIQLIIIHHLPIKKIGLKSKIGLKFSFYYTVYLIIYRRAYAIRSYTKEKIL